MVYELISQYGITALTWILAGVGLLLAKYLLAKIENDTARGIAQRLWAEVQAAVLEVGQVFVDGLRDDDGKITAATKKNAKNMAIAKAKANLGKSGLAKLAKIVGLGNVDEYIGGKIEAFIGSTKLPKATAKELPEKP